METTKPQGAAMTSTQRAEYACKLASKYTRPAEPKAPKPLRLFSEEAGR